MKQEDLVGQEDLREHVNLERFQGAVATASKYLGEAHSNMEEVAKSCRAVVRRAGRSPIARELEGRWSWEAEKSAQDCKDRILVFVDFRWFKLVNSVHGMDGGNMAIEEFGRRLYGFFSHDKGEPRGWKESRDWSAFHYGGDEFILLCSGAVWEAFQAWWPANARFEVLHRRGVKHLGEVLVRECRFEVEANAGWIKGNDTSPREELRNQAEKACQDSKLEGIGTLVEYRGAKQSRGSVRAIRFECEGEGCNTSGVLCVEREKVAAIKCPVCGAAWKEGPEGPYQACGAERRELPRD